MRSVIRAKYLTALGIFFLIAPSQTVLAEEPHHWSGAYVGGQVGYAWGDFDAAASVNSQIGNIVSGANSTELSQDGLIGGVHAGYNLQFSKMVFGVVGDFNWGDVDANGELLTVTNPNGRNSYTIDAYDVEMNWLATLRAKVGYLADPYTLLYVTGGLAVADIDSKFTFSASNVPPDVQGSGSSSDVQTGYAIGAGFEYAFTTRLRASAEFLYVDLDAGDVFTHTYRSNRNGSNTAQASYDDLDFETVKIGLSYSLQ